MKKTYTFESRCDIRSFATVATYLENKGVSLTKSAVGAYCLDILAHLLIEKSEAPEYDIDSAVDALNSMGLTPNSTKSKRKLFVERQLSSLSKEEIEIPDNFQKKTKTRGVEDDPQFAALVKRHTKVPPAHNSDDIAVPLPNIETRNEDEND